MAFNLLCTYVCVFMFVYPQLYIAYVRTVYGIEGHPGWDVCIALCPCTCLCSSCQLYTQVRHSGRPLSAPPLNKALLVPVCPDSCRHSVCVDPCGLIMTALTAPCTSASLGAQVTGLPFWMHLICSSFYLNRHLVRKNFGAPGTDIVEGIHMN
jgi:hypothetical protein